MSLEFWAVISQIAAAAGTLILAFAVWFQIRVARQQTAATRETVEERRASRLAQERPHIIVDADYSDPNIVYVVVRNIGKGAAKNITFCFSHPLESHLRDPKDPSKNFVISELAYFEEGLDYLAPGSAITTGWGTFRELFNLLTNKKLQDGIEVVSHYQDLSGRDYHTSWKINPLKVEGVLDIG
jgi:hypothetical protein